ncbi:MAG TPA: serine kinase [Gammaproteobacteria bacterium]|nr:serine kinase [Gammaproteobacteria bacterium]
MADLPDSTISDLLADPFGERVRMIEREPLALLGAQFHFESNSRPLMELVDQAYAGLPAHRLSRTSPRLRVRILEAPAALAHRRSEPPQLAMFSAGGFLAGAAEASSFVAVSPEARTALVVLSPRMLASPYHARYEALEFAVFTLASRVQGLAPLHAACISRRGRGLLLMGQSGAGKSTIALLSLLHGFDFVSEDSVFVAPDSLRATGVANFLHVRSDSMRWIAQTEQAAAIRQSPVIRRRSGVRKFEVDLRRQSYRLAAAAPRIIAVIFLSADSAGDGRLLHPLSDSDVLTRLAAAQAYAAGQTSWEAFSRGIARLDSFELRRGRHPLDSVEALDRLLKGSNARPRSIRAR